MLRRQGHKLNFKSRREGACSDSSRAVKDAHSIYCRAAVERRGRELKFKSCRQESALHLLSCRRQGRELHFKLRRREHALHLLLCHRQGHELHFKSRRRWLALHLLLRRRRGRELHFKSRRRDCALHFLSRHQGCELQFQVAPSRVRPS